MLVNALGTKEGYRLDAMKLLQEMGAPAVPVVSGALHNKNMWARKDAAEVLTQIRKASAVPKLLRTLQDDES